MIALKDLYFSAPEAWISLLLLIPVLMAGLFGWRSRQKWLENIWGAYAPLFATVSPFFRLKKTVFFALGVLLSAFALMGPEGNLRQSEQFTTVPLNLYLLIDTSYSMSVTDGLNNQSRLERALKISDQLLKRTSMNAVGLYAFTDRLHSIAPLTYDHFFVRLLLRDLTVEGSGYYGTDFLPVLKDLKDKLASREHGGKDLVLLLTDGEDTRIQSLNEVEQNQAVHAILTETEGLSLIAIGIGSDAGGLIPDFTVEGKPVFSKRDMGFLQKIARGKGMADGNDTVDWILDQVEAARREFSLEKGKNWLSTAYFQWPLGLAILFFLFSIPLPVRSGGLFLLLFLKLHALEIWEEDRMLYNASYDAMEKGDEADSMYLLLGISPQAYASPIFRSRIAINYAESAMEYGLREQGLKVIQLLGLVPCEPASLCSPVLKELVEKRLMEPLEGKERSLQTSLLSQDKIILLHFAAMVPVKEVLESIAREIPEAESALDSKLPSVDLLKIELKWLQNYLPQSPREAIEKMLFETVASSFLQLMTASLTEVQALKNSYPLFLKALFQFQESGFLANKCQCTPWKDTMPLITEAGRYIQAAAEGERSQQELYVLLFMASKKLREALSLFKDSASDTLSNQEESNELQEMQQQDMPKMAPKIMKGLQGRPW